MAQHHRVECWDGDWLCGSVDCPARGESPEDYAAHIQAELAKASTIETVEQLDALPDGSVIHVPHKPSAASIEKSLGLWWPNHGEGPMPNARRGELCGAFVLWHPERDQ